MYTKKLKNTFNGKLTPSNLINIHYNLQYTKKHALYSDDIKYLTYIYSDDVKYLT